MKDNGLDGMVSANNLASEKFHYKEGGAGG